MVLKDILKYQEGGLTLTKIQNIINRYGGGKSPFTVNDYIEVSKNTGVPIDLLLAQGIQESNLGTQGRAVRTRNVGNVGNTDNGTANYQNSWIKGLYRQADLLKKEYKVTDTTDVQRLVSNNFIRPERGGRYATDKNYGSKVGNLLNKLHGKKVYETNKNTQTKTEKDKKQSNLPPINGGSWLTYNEGTPLPSTTSDMGFWSLPIDIQSTIIENQKLESERLNQEIVANEWEKENLAIEAGLKEKQLERQQILSTIPQAQYVGQTKLQPNPLTLPQSNVEFMQQGGWVPFSDRQVNPEVIRGFYQDMVSAPWYKERLEKNGYNSKLDPSNWFGNGAQSEVDYRLKRLNSAKVNKIDTSKLPFSAQEAERYKALNQLGTNWNPASNEINYKLKDSFLNQKKAEPYEVITHEFGHAESANRLNKYESDLLTNRLSNRVKEAHDKDPLENKADINTLRYNLYRKGLYDPNKGTYKTDSGRFESKLLDNVKSQFIIKRLQQNYDPKDLEFLVNTIAFNYTPDENLQYAQQGGKVTYNKEGDYYGTEDIEEVMISPQQPFRKNTVDNLRVNRDLDASLNLKNYKGKNQVNQDVIKENTPWYLKALAPTTTEKANNIFNDLSKYYNKRNRLPMRVDENSSSLDKEIASNVNSQIGVYSKEENDLRNRISNASTFFYPEGIQDLDNLVSNIENNKQGEAKVKAYFNNEKHTDLTNALTDKYFNVGDTSAFIVPSNYRPTKTTDQNTSYYDFSDTEKRKLIQDLIDNGVDLNFNSYVDKRAKSKNKVLQTGNFYGLNQLGNYTLSGGEDKNGKYLSYYDKWDLAASRNKNIDNTINKINNPFEIYGRIYEKDFNLLKNKK